MNVIFRKEDKHGNALVFTEYQVWIDIELYLVSESKPRHIANASHDMKILRFNRTNPDHLFRKTNSYGFCSDLLSMENWVTIVVNAPEAQYVVSRGDFIRAGSFLHFKPLGFETQIFVPVDFLENYRMEEI